MKNIDRLPFPSLLQEFVNYDPMKNETKYYTPDIEEVHIGFRLEEKQDSLYAERRKWIVREIKYPHDIQRVSVALKQPLMDGKHVRVKYLDRADIEELGWEYKDKMLAREVHIFNKTAAVGEVRMEFTYKNGLSIQYFNDHFGNYRYMFMGNVKNYNELKKIMKMLGI